LLPSSSSDTQPADAERWGDETAGVDRASSAETGATSSPDVEALFRAHYPALRRYGERLTPRATLVEDAIQDVFLALCDRPADADPLSSPRSYLLTSLRRRILRRLDADGRRKSRHERYVRDEPTFAVSSNDVIAANEWIANRREKLAHALDTLSDRRREALYLRFYHGLRYSEVADVMDIRSQSARNYVSEALIHLRKTVE
jgi:RNA polymerase sigma factor (sigma-70 family)